MSGAIAKALPTCIGRTLGRVGFAWGWQLLLKFTNLPISAKPPISTASTGFGGKRVCQANPARVFSTTVSDEGVGRGIPFPL